MSGSLFVSGEYMSYSFAAEVKLVEKVDDLIAGIAENSVYALFDKNFNGDFSS